MISVSGGSDPVSVALTKDLMVVSCVPGWTERDWTDALSTHRHIKADL